MVTSEIISELEKNSEVFNLLLQVNQKLQVWKPQADKWCLLEVICHLYDEEREDFRERLKHTFEKPDQDFKPIDPEGWVKERNYLQKDFKDVLDKFILERKNSVAWLRSLKNPPWNNRAKQPKLGELSAELLLVNWLAHDYFHFRQITRLKFEFLKQHTAFSLDYAGKW